MQKPQVDISEGLIWQHHLSKGPNRQIFKTYFHPNEKFYHVHEIINTLSNGVGCTLHTILTNNLLAKNYLKE